MVILIGAERHDSRCHDAKKRHEVPKLEATEGGFKTRLRYGKGLRQRFLICLEDEEVAERRAVALQAMVNVLAHAGKHAEAPIILRKGGAVTTEDDFQEVVRFVETLCQKKVEPERLTPRMTFEDFAKQWTSGELHKDYPDHVKLKRSAVSDRCRLKRPFEAIGEVEIQAFRLEHAEIAMRALPAEFSSASRRQYAQLISKVLRLAVYPCKLIPRSPLPVGFLPAVTSQKVTAWLYPDEDARLMASPPEKVPRLYRVLYGFLAREGMRLGEALRLRRRDVDLSRGIVNQDENKTDDPRSWASSAGVAAALKAVKPEDAEADWLLFGGVPENHAAETFREYLKAAGVDRANCLMRRRHVARSESTTFGQRS